MTHGQEGVLSIRELREDLPKEGTGEGKVIWAEGQPV